MNEPQTATRSFFAPMAAAYLTACGGGLAYDRQRFGAASRPLSETTRRYVDLLCAMLAIAGILILGAVYRAGWPLPTGNDFAGRCGWLIDTLAIYSPLAIVLIVRRQGTDTIYLSRDLLGEKICFGLVFGVIGVAVYAALRGELGQFPTWIAAAIERDKLIDFLPVFFEGVAVAFIFVRLRWVVGVKAAILLPTLFFAVAHVPGQIADGQSLGYMAAFLVFNTALVAAILGTVARSRDVIWIGLVHYLMDIAIRAI